MARYKWDSPDDWLGDKINKCKDDIDEYLRNGVSGDGSYDKADTALFELVSIANTLVLDSDAVDSDTIQDLFQDDMDTDGYFIDLDVANRLSREQCVSLLEDDLGIACNDDEGIDVLREAVLSNIQDGSLSYEQVKEMAGDEETKD